MNLKEFFSFSWLTNLFGKKPIDENKTDVSSMVDDPLYDFELTEAMWGYVSELQAPAEIGETVAPVKAEDYLEYYKKGKEGGNKLQYKVTLHVTCFQEFTAPSGRRAPMTGWVSCPNLYGEKLEIMNGEYGLYWVDPHTGGRRISYKFDFKDNDGVKYHFSGYKVIVHEKGEFDVLEDQTTLFAKIEKTEPGKKAIVACGIIHYHIEDFPEMVASIRTPSNDTLLNRLRVTAKFFAFVDKEVSEYFKAVKPLYTAQYNNLVLAGTLLTDNTKKQFFFFSGVHDKGFPWGDNVGFTDVALIIRDGERWRRFATTAHSIPSLTFRLTEGVYSLDGTVYEITEGFKVSFSDIYGDSLANHIEKTGIKIDLRFVPEKLDKTQIPFELNRESLGETHTKLWKKIEESDVYQELEKWRGVVPEIGYTTEIFRVTDVQGTIDISGENYKIEKQKTLGEGENGTITNLRCPQLYYNYFCAIEPEADRFRVHVRSSVLKKLAQDLISSKTEDVMGNLIGQVSARDISAKNNKTDNLEPDVAENLIIPLESLLEINNDQYPNATFQRRIVTLKGLEEPVALSLEEDMSVISLEPIRTDRSAKVAAICCPDRFAALDAVLKDTNFFETLDRARLQSGKHKEEFSVIVKPSFSFMYSLTDRSTFTDPSLVEHLIDRISEKGYRNVALAEAQSTYASFFTNRDVLTLAKYVGYKSRNYEVIDLSQNTVPHEYGKTLGSHEVHPAWRDADFRISFAKNKTHSYAYYTLTIKNIYGALPRQNKFKEYHWKKDMGIYKPTIDYLEAFPVHFGLIDGHISADGAFGIFADLEPNFTQTIIGGDDLVAVDWVAASKMGLDPMISDYMNEAVNRFGKPKIMLYGDHSLYRNWRNVPAIISNVAHSGMDSNYMFGNFLYSIMGSMDPFFRFKCDETSRRVARLLTKPIRKILFEWVKGDQDELTWRHLKQLFDEEQQVYVKKLLKSLLGGDEA